MNRRSRRPSSAMRSPATDSELPYIGEESITFPAQAKAKIGVIGSGRIGSTLGGLWAKAGHEIMFSDRDGEQSKRAAEAAGPRARTGSVEEAVAFGDAVLIAVPYAALPAIAQQV